ncbi:DNA alkylation repair protein [Gordonia sp. X0973]|uniref:DNA alkylation repair protein n=1 Tax=Gordonia sp. X0973 TaxID=2742602 RepID=UPI000F54946D|nr:DNA alkylation repair protein [Gordonia sp. X0973]QKT09246.1 DNA alkylation repair protein [Gordonia sp. X0973]
MAVGDPARAASAAGFFKTGPGEYGEGDVFAGVSVPELRKLARGFRGTSLPTVAALLDDELHEVRMLALFLMVDGYERASDSARAEWVQGYRDAVAAGRVNNWDLVDSSARQILGAWCVASGDFDELVAYARREALWERRVGIVGTHAHLFVGDAAATLAVAPVVVDDRRDLIQKAFGWMLREMGKRVSRETLIGYLDAHAPELGRTALSYAVEHLDPDLRAHYRSLR